MNIFSDVIKSLEIQGYKAEVIQIEKNGITVNGLQIHCNDSSIEPVVYLDDIDELDRALAICKEAIDSASVLYVPKELTDPDFILENVYVCLEHVHECDYITFPTEFFDIQAYLRVFIKDNASFKLKSEHISRLDLLPEVIFNAGMLNTSLNARIRTLEETIGFPACSFEDCLFAVIDNPRGSFGSGAILDKDLQLALKSKMHAKKLFVIPSSVHEIIVINADKTDGDLEPMIEMVKEVNREAVEPFDKLTDNAYTI